MQGLRAVVRAHGEDRLALGELRLERADQAVEEAHRLAAVRCAEQHLEGGAERERGAVGELEARIGEPDRGAVGQPQVLVDADLEHLGLHGRIEGLAVDLDLGAGEQWAA